jgi:hypothetical protein
MTFERQNLPDPRAYYEEREGLTLTGRGKWRSTRCEFHGSTHSMRINLESGAFVCMAGCGARGGDIVAYDMAAHGRGFVEAARALGAWQDDATGQQMPRRRPLPLPPRDCLEVLHAETMFVAVAAFNLAYGVELTQGERDQLLTAARRISAIYAAVGAPAASTPAVPAKARTPRPIEEPA